MSENILITGGAGFIGSHVATELLAHGYRVRVLDNLSPQVHGPGQRRPEYLDPEIELIVGDVRNASAVREALRGVSAVFHFAAAVGVGQSMYEVSKYMSTNTVGTAVLLEVLMEQPVEKLIVASSMSIYGEGMYADASGRQVAGVERPAEQLRRHEWELCGEDGRALMPLPTPEEKRPALSSVYALSKYDQERLCLMVGKAYGIPTVALRFFNVYGTRQALSNPYTGVLAIFASRLLNNHSPLIFEDGYQQRDFVSVRDVARACRLALERAEARDVAINIGSGRAYTVRQIAERMAEATGRGHVEATISGKYRVGDIRHCFAEIGLARRILGYEPEVKLDDGLAELAEWLVGQAAADHVAEATHELTARGLAL